MTRSVCRRYRRWDVCGPTRSPTDDPERVSDDGTRLVLVSNRGPVTFEAGGRIQRGGGGLVTALTGLASHREVIWIASAMSEHDAAVSRENHGRPFKVQSPAGGNYLVRLVESDPEAYDRFYNVFANPMLWFIQHYLWDLSNAPDVRRNEIEAFEAGYNVVNADLARAVIEEIEDVDEPVVMVHDYHLYTLPELVRRARPEVFLHHFVHIPWTQSDAWRVLPASIREAIFSGLLANDIVGFHTRSYRRNFLQCCRDLMDLEVDFERNVVHWHDREVWVRAYPLPIDAVATRAAATSARVGEFEARLKARRRDFQILRVDRADLSKNVLRGFSAFDLFLEQHPEFVERITFVAQLMPSRTDVPEYAEYLERIEAVVAVVNHRHGTPDWMPIQLKLRDDLEEALASYKHYDVLLVNAMFDGMNLVAKEGPLLNEQGGVSILSENTGAHEELGEYALSVNPFDIQELADSIYAALTMGTDERAERLAGLKAIVTARDPGDWIDDQLADIREKALDNAD
jgi:trehalose 6-phosphate synthase